MPDFYAVVIVTPYLDQSTFFVVVKHSKRRAHCTETRGVEKSMGPSMGTEKTKLVCSKLATDFLVVTMNLETTSRPLG